MRRFSDRPLSTQFLIAGGIVAVCSTISLILLLMEVKSQTDSSRIVTQAYQKITQLNAISRTLYEVQSQVQGLTEDPQPTRIEAFKETFQAAIPKVDHVEWLEPWYFNTIALVELAMASSHRVDSQAQVLLDQEKSYREAFLKADQLISSERKVLEVEQKKEEDGLEHRLLWIAITNITLLFVFGLVLFRLYSSIARPISNLSSGMKRFLEGDLSSRIRVTNTNEIGFLEKTFNELSDQIEKMIADLKQLDELKSEFLSTVSHELRTPLTSIKGYLKLISSGEAGEVTPTQEEFVQIVYSNVERLENLINDLLDVEKMESGQLQLVKERIDLVELIKECRDTFQVMASEKGLEFTLSLKCEEAWIEGDRRRLIQVFSNLLSNAIKYTREGHVRIEVELQELVVRVLIEDTGSGISEKDQKNLFNRFYRTRHALQSGQGGTGLGLTIVRGILEAHSGTVKFKSRLGVGTEVRVSLPR